MNKLNGPFMPYRIRCGNRTCQNTIDSREIDKTGLCKECQEWERSQRVNDTATLYVGR